MAFNLAAADDTQLKNSVLLLSLKKKYLEHTWKPGSGILVNQTRYVSAVKKENTY